MSTTEASGWADEEEVRFGSFRLLPVQRMLLLDDLPLHLGSRALDILLMLVERAGDFVSNEELVRRVWPRTVVVDGNLRVHVAALRKALSDGRDGQRFIINVPNRGYSFIGKLSRSAAPAARSEAAVVKRRVVGLPSPLQRVIGRQQAIEALGANLRRHRLVTLVGAGGIGKTTVALSVVSGGSAVDDREPLPWNSVRFVDLAPLHSAELVPSALASALGLAAVAEDAMANLLAYLTDKSTLLVFDNCEHVLSAVADAVETIQHGAPDVRVLATSREPLRAAGEWVQRLQALELPPMTAPLSAETASEFSAIELLVERVSATLDTFAFTDADVPAAVEICRRLDGIPLAIELAAARVNPLGMRGVASALDNCFALLNKGRRTALPRHRTLQATLDWSFSLLSERDRTLLLRLSTFAGSFTLQSATAVTAWGGLSAEDVLDAISDLSAKSLVATDVSQDEVLFRLLETTRVYAFQRLADSGESSLVSRRHAEHFLELLMDEEAAWQSTPTDAWRRHYGRRVDDVRKALRWAFSAGGDSRLGIALTAKSAFLFFQLSFSEELRANSERALVALANDPQDDQELEFELKIIYGHALFNTRGLQADSELAFNRALQIAERSGDRRQRALAYSTNWMGGYNSGNPPLMIEFARKFEAVIEGDDDPVMTTLLDRMMAAALHLNGDQRLARSVAERSLATPGLFRPPFLSGSQIDRRVSTGVILARVLWLQGLPLKAEEVVSRTVEIAIRDGESVALAFALGFAAVPIAIWSGAYGLARERIALLLRHSTEHSLFGWRACGRGAERLLDWHERGESSELFPNGLLREVESHPPFADLMTTLHTEYPGGSALGRAEAGKSGWCLAEVLRFTGEQALAEDPTLAERMFLRAHEVAQRDGAFAWELRSVISLAKLWFRTDRGSEGFELLDSTLRKVKEGFATSDFRRAVELYIATATAIGVPAVQTFPTAG